ncbi:sulfatase-like hydrolase/transferase [Robiginitalea marina]|uniref:Sulfatase-like hydrolase/transferase n=1 Tax=Robiginitalea marina TaxID=2954105 RepID=A0ABT1AVG2_9FLAO|nr:sulfatase-like hydrolase/transferase [Robiginitalea marina]MCO5723545.1 sulfatase-like hydrolase/transferase [Robiginitalea marina]
MEAQLQSRDQKAAGLQGYTRLVLAFFGGLLLLGVYQQIRLYADGVLDSALNANLLMLGIHHLGYASLVALICAFAFNPIENARAGWGMRILGMVFVGLLGVEYLLTEVYLTRFELAGHSGGWQLPRLWALNLFLALLLLGGAFYLFYRWSGRVPQWIGRMYPLTIVLFALFLGTLLSEQRPVNRNKTQFLLWDYSRHVADGEVYRGKDPYPLWSEWNPEDVLGPFLDWPESRPNIMMVFMEGLSSDFVGENAPFKAFMPFADSLRTSGLYWKRYLANARTGVETLPLATGSLPPGETGFMQQEEFPWRLTLFSILKSNGYRTSFQYGGNASLFGWDRFLFQERTDEVTDRKSFGRGYTPQREDGAGNSLGYPDHVLYERYLNTRVPLHNPAFDVFQTLSSRSPYLIPGAERYQSQVDSLLESQTFSRREKRFIRKNREWMAAMRYADDCLRRFILELGKSTKYPNTLIILTGTHHPAGVPSKNPLKQYQVPLIMAGPMVKSPKTFNTLASHLDLAPSLIGSLEKRYGLDIPGKAAWLGRALTSKGRQEAVKTIPLSGPGARLTDFVAGDYALVQGRPYHIGEDFELESGIPEHIGDSLHSAFSRFKAVNRHVTRDNSLIPEQALLYKPLVPPIENMDLAWIHSVFPGTDFDRAYELARELALQGNRERAAQLCRFILARVPGHVDTEILLGRIKAWNGDYEGAAGLLEQVVQKYPLYEDGYSALMDVYHWGGEHEKALFLVPSIETHLKGSEVLENKVKRAMGNHPAEPEHTGEREPMAANEWGS